MKPALLASIWLLLACPAVARGVQGQVEDENQQFDRAFNKGNAAGMAALYTPQATIMPPNHAAVHGRAAIQQFWQQIIDAGVTHLVVTADTVKSYGREVREIGHLSYDKPDPRQGTVHVVGKYLVLWRQTRAGWLVDTGIWNLDN